MVSKRIECMANTKPTVFSINFRLNTQRTKRGNAAIYVRITVENKRVEIATRQSVLLNQWNQKLQCAIGDTDKIADVNKQLAIIRADILKHYNKMTVLSKTVTAELLKNEYLGITERSRSLKELQEFYFQRFQEKVNSGISHCPSYFRYNCYPYKWRINRKCK